MPEYIIQINSYFIVSLSVTSNLMLHSNALFSGSMKFVKALMPFFCQKTHFCAIFFLFYLLCIYVVVILFKFVYNNYQMNVENHTTATAPVVYDYE